MIKLESAFGTFYIEQIVEMTKNCSKTFLKMSGRALNKYAAKTKAVLFGFG
jgi:hypothetical protein